MRTVSVDAARRIALGAQGFGANRPSGRIDVRHFRRVMANLGLVQLDSVNVCVRTHYMPFYARLGPYDQEALDRWLNESGENFEYWAHEAAVLPVDGYPLWRWKMDEMQPWRRAAALLEEHPELLDDVQRQVRDHGPLTVRDLDAPDHRNEQWWGYGPGKVALEVLFANGHITALRSNHFTRVYDTPDRAIPDRYRSAPAVPKEQAFRILLGKAARHLGVGTAHDLADYYRLHVPTSRPILALMAAAGELEEVVVPGWRGPVYLHPEAKRPHRIDGATFLSPFDPVVWYRERAERLFGFRYRIEIYVPEPKRVFGYYVLPFMLDGDLVGRADLKADRSARTLLVRSAWREDGVDTARVARAMSDQLAVFADWLGLDSVIVEPRGNLAPSLSI